MNEKQSFKKPLTKTYKEQEGEKRHGKKRYIHRLAEEAEAALEVEEFLDQKEEEVENENRTTIRPFS